MNVDAMVFDRGVVSRRSDETDGSTRYQARRALLESHLARLEHALADVSRSKVRTPWMLVGLLAVVPARIAWGSIGALGAFLVAMAIAVMGRYVTWAHQQEYASQHDAIRQQIVDLDEAFEHGPRMRTPWRIEGKRTQL